MKKTAFYFCALMSLLLGGSFSLTSAETNAPALATAEKIIFPPPMPYPSDPISPAIPATSGETYFINDDDKQFTLFVPRVWQAPASGETALTVHFNGEVNMIIQQHLSRGLSNPLVVVTWGTGTEAYRVPFTDTNRFGRWLKLTEEKLVETGSPKNTRVTLVDMSAYGGGYGAIRNVLKDEAHFKMIRRIVLSDALYASYSKEPSSDGKRKLAPEHLNPWLPFVRAAAKGEKTFAFTFSAIETRGYASCSECAMTLAEIVGAKVQPVELDSCPAANVDDFPLTAQGDLGHFHVWGYAGVADKGHATHVWHLGDVWKVLDEAGAP